MNGTPELINDFWTCMQNRDWTQLSALIADDFRGEFPQSGEVFTKYQYIAMNRHYPGAWSITINNILQCERCFVSEIRVDISGKTDYAIGFFTIKGIQISALREFWAEPFAVPDWRKSLLAQTNHDIP